MNWYVPWNENNSVNEYNCLECLNFLWINIRSSNEFISLKLHTYTVAERKIMPWVQIYFIECDDMCFLNFASFTNGQP